MRMIVVIVTTSFRPIAVRASNSIGHTRHRLKILREKERLRKALVCAAAMWHIRPRIYGRRDRGAGFTGP
jgi:hypothetical protein